MKQPTLHAQQLWLARHTGSFCDPIPEPLSVTQAYSIQTACTQTASAEETVIGYKIGATNDETLGILGLDSPFYGPLYKSAFSKNNGHKERLQLPLFTQHKPRVEAEFVVCMKNDFARGSSKADIVIDDVLEHIDWIAPGLEVVASRFSGTIDNPGCHAIADFGANQHMVVGPPCSNWHKLDLNSHPVKLEITNQPDVNGHSGMSIYGNPIGFVCWLLNQTTMHADGLRAGQFVSCGTCTGAPFVDSGDHVTANYGEFGCLAVEIVAKNNK